MNKAAVKPKIVESFGLGFLAFSSRVMERCCSYVTILSRGNLRPRSSYNLRWLVAARCSEALGARLDCDVVRVVPPRETVFPLPPPIEDVDAGALYEE